MPKQLTREDVSSKPIAGLYAHPLSIVVGGRQHRIRCVPDAIEVRVCEVISVAVGAMLPAIALVLLAIVPLALGRPPHKVLTSSVESRGVADLLPGPTSKYPWLRSEVSPGERSYGGATMLRLQPLRPFVVLVCVNFGF